MLHYYTSQMCVSLIFWILKSDVSMYIQIHAHHNIRFVILYQFDTHENYCLFTFTLKINGSKYFYTFFNVFYSNCCLYFLPGDDCNSDYDDLYKESYSSVFCPCNKGLTCNKTTVSVKP